MTILEFKQRPVIQRILSEIGQKVEPYLKQDMVKFTKNTYEEPSFTFKDDESNKIEVRFVDAGKGVQEAEFLVNGDSFQKFKTSTKHYFKILSTVIEVVNKYLKEYEPYMIKVDGIDKDPEHRGQKNAIYRAYAKSMIDGTNYRVADLTNGFVLSK